MSRTLPAGLTKSSPELTQDPRASSRLGSFDVFILSCWCGLAGGLLEVATRVVFRWIDPAKRLYGLSRHHVWLTPLSTLLFFGGAGAFLAVATRLSPRGGAWFSTRLICFWAVLPALLIAGPGIYPVAWQIVALGITARAGQMLERHAATLRRRLVLSFPPLVGAVLVLATLLFGGDWLKSLREKSRPLPPADSPNVLLIVLDTVRADRLSLYGYTRRTTPTLERLAERAIRFDEARATAPWTLASHASLFSGRWPHELGVKWLTPLRGNDPMLAEYLGSHGYATAGFVANKLYCSYETQLDRGFTHYEDYQLQQLMPLRTAWLVDRFLDGVKTIGTAIGQTFGIGPFYRPEQESWIADLVTVVNPRKNAAVVNGEFLNWLRGRAEPARPFFAFLNYFDVHSPYLLPGNARYSFGLKPQRMADFVFLSDYWASVDKLKLRPFFRTLACDSYDNCIAYLDEQLGHLFDELARSGVLGRTLIVVTSDHGEELGDHGLYDHGQSVYRGEIRVPLLIVPPGRDRSQRIVSDMVSLRDLPATVVDLVGLAAGSPFSRTVAGAILAGFRAGADGDSRRRGFLRVSQPQSIRPESGPFASLSRPSRVGGPGRICLHPEPRRWGRGIV